MAKDGRGQTRRSRAKPALANSESVSPKVMQRMQYENGRDMSAVDYPFVERVKIGWPVAVAVLSLVGVVLTSLLMNHWLTVPAKQFDMDYLSKRVGAIEEKMDKVLTVVTEINVARRVEEGVKASAPVPAQPVKRAASAVKPPTQQGWSLFAK